MRTLLAVLCVALAGGSALVLTTDGLRAFTSEDARRLEVSEAPVQLPVLEVLGTDGRLVSLSDPDRVTLLDFVYTCCETVCRALGSEFRQLQTEIRARGLQDRVRLLSISFDPEHDTPAELAAYARHQRADGAVWQFAALANSAELPKLLGNFGIVVIPDGLGGFEHNAAIHVVDQRGRLVRIMDLANPAAALAEALARIEAGNATKARAGS
ncbi:MAG: SCO family protein [Rhodocyclaceae bacterium]|nr:MAG: SCO family protein [Rhodocyclaceae bacterium]